MATCDWVIMCEHVLIERNGKPSVIGIFNRVRVNAFPIAYPRLFVIASFAGLSGTPGELHDVWLVLRCPGGKEEVVQKMKAKAGPSGGAYAIFGVEGLPLESEGQHFLEVMLNGKRAGTTAFEVEVRKDLGDSQGRERDAGQS